MTATPNYPKIFAAHFEERAVNYVDPHRQLSRAEADRVLNENSGMFTLTFDQDRLANIRALTGRPYVDVSFEFDEFNHLYGRICRTIYGRRYDLAQIRGRLPLVLAVLELESRFGGPQFGGPFPHIHAVMVTRPDVHGDSFEAWSEIWARLHSSGKLLSKSLDARKTDLTKGDFRKLVRYTLKNLGPMEWVNALEDCIRVYPQVVPLTPTYPATRVYGDTATQPEPAPFLSTIN